MRTTSYDHQIPECLQRSAVVSQGIREVFREILLIRQGLSGQNHPLGSCAIAGVELAEVDAA